MICLQKGKVDEGDTEGYSTGGVQCNWMNGLAAICVGENFASFHLLVPFSTVMCVYCMLCQLINFYRCAFYLRHSVTVERSSITVPRDVRSCFVFCLIRTLVTWSECTLRSVCCSFLPASIILLHKHPVGNSYPGRLLLAWELYQYFISLHLLVVSGLSSLLTN